MLLILILTNSTELNKNKIPKLRPEFLAQSILSQCIVLNFIESNSKKFKKLTTRLGVMEGKIEDIKQDYFKEDDYFK